MIDLDLAELWRLSDAATPGPWEAREHDTLWDVYAERDGDWYQVFDVLPDKPNCEFVVAMRNVLPALLSRLEQAEAERAQGKEALQIVVTQMLLAFRRRTEVDAERDALRLTLTHIAALAIGGLTTDGIYPKQKALADIAQSAGIQGDTLHSLDVDVGFSS